MSTLEIACGHCDKRFRVRAEFAGKSTRCPGCSAPLVVGAMTAAPPPVDDEAPRRRARPRPVDDERPTTPDHDWHAVGTAFRREQTALYFIVLQVVCELFVWLLLLMTGRDIYANPVVLLLALLFGVGPSLAAGVMGMLARLAALSAPPEARVKGSALASLFAGIVAFGCVISIGIVQFMMMDSRRMAGEFALSVAIGGAIVAGIVSFLSFGVFTAQVGVMRRSMEVSVALGRMAIAGTVAVVLLIGGSGLIAVLQLLEPPRYYAGGYSYSSRPRYGDVFLGLLAIVLPVMLIVLLIMYHQLLAAGKRAIKRR